MAIRIPIVRHFLACEEVEVSPDGSEFSLRNVLYAIKPPVGASYPSFKHPRIDLFALMTDGHGQLSILIQFVRWEGTEERSIYKGGETIINFREDPLKFVVLRKRLYNVPFESPGQYEFRLLYEEEIIAHVPLLLLPSPLGDRS